MYIYMYSGPCILRPPLQPEKYGLKLEVVLKYRDIHIEHITMLSLVASLKMKGIVKWRGLKSQGPLYSKQEPHGPLFKRKWRFAHVQQPNRPEYHSNFSVFGVLLGIWWEFDVMCFLLQGSVHLLGNALVYNTILHIRHQQ